MEQAANCPEEKWNAVYPIDETEDLQDPFSEVSLFLARKLRGEVAKSGEWSTQIQTSLLEKILPEFRKAFPQRRLGTSALKTMWEKVAYYYGKVQREKDALRGDGKLNIAFMVRENLKGDEARHLSSSLPPYHMASTIAAKVSECIATLDGERPNVEELTQVIWSAQKHLVPDLSAQMAKNAFAEYGPVDKLVVQAQLEILSRTPNVNREGLEKGVVAQLDKYRMLMREKSREELYSAVAIAIAKGRFHTTSLKRDLSEEELSYVEDFIERQMTLVHREGAEESGHIEAIQRVLALYPLTVALPESFDEATIRRAIQTMHAILCGEEVEMDVPIDHATFALINAEIHFLSRHEEFNAYPLLENCIVETLYMCNRLPAWRDEYIDELEIALWNAMDLPKEARMLESEIGAALLDAPHLSFQGAVYRVLEFIDKAEEILTHAPGLSTSLSLWTGQSDMACRWLHFDKRAPLYQLMKAKWDGLQGDEREVDHNAFVDLVFRTYIARFPALSRWEGVLKERIWTLYKFHWYNVLIREGESSLDRYVKWHGARLRREGIVDPVAAIDAIIALSKKAIPLVPINRDRALTLLTQ